MMNQLYWLIAANTGYSNYQQMVEENERKRAEGHARMEEMKAQFEQRQAQNEMFSGFVITIIVVVVIVKLLMFIAQVSAATKVQGSASKAKVSKNLFGMSEKGDAAITKYDSLQGMSADEMLGLGFLTYGALTAAQMQRNMDDMQMQMDQMQLDMQVSQNFMDEMQRDMQFQMEQMQRDMQFQMDLNDPCNYGVLSGHEDIFQNDMNSFGSGFDSFGGGFDSFGGMGF